MLMEVTAKSFNAMLPSYIMKKPVGDDCQNAPTPGVRLGGCQNSLTPGKQGEMS